MTAIVGTLNRIGVAFAADSAATHRMSNTSKITNHANKIFALSRKRPVGIAIYSNMDFLGVPWETIIKLYRDSHLQDNAFPLLKDYIADFWKFLHEYVVPTIEKDQKSQVFIAANGLKNEIFQLANNELKDKKEDINDESLFKEMLTLLQGFYAVYSQENRSSEFDSYSKERFAEYSKEIIYAVLADWKANEKCPKVFISTFIETLFYIMISDKSIYLVSTGLVFWGFGEDELFPSYFNYEVSLSIDERIKYVEQHSYVVSNTTNACVAPFAQTDVANTVVRGIDQKLRDTIGENVSKYFETFKNVIIDSFKKIGAPDNVLQPLNAINSNEYVKPFIEDLNQFINKNYIDNLLNTVAVLSKEDLAEMAESLVKITCLKRHITTDEESVGGPVDVAVITKGDGFVWIKRKHYFSAELNYQYFNNKK